MFFPFGRKRALANQLVERLHADIVAAVRRPEFYTDYGVADTFEGRFELLTLHAGLALKRLNDAEAPGPALAQHLVDTIFRHLDAGLREMGVGDLAVPKRMKKLAEAFLGRSAAYDLALREGEQALAAALLRNMFDGRGAANAMARYGLAAHLRMNEASLEALLNHPLPFPVVTRVEHRVLQ